MVKVLTGTTGQGQVAQGAWWVHAEQLTTRVRTKGEWRLHAEQSVAGVQTKCKQTRVLRHHTRHGHATAMLDLDP